jgi:hypothetical protein
MVVVLRTHRTVLDRVNASVSSVVRDQVSVANVTFIRVKLTLKTVFDETWFTLRLFIFGNIVVKVESIFTILADPSVCLLVNIKSEHSKGIKRLLICTHFAVINESHTFVSPRRNHKVIVFAIIAYPSIIKVALRAHSNQWVVH